MQSIQVSEEVGGNSFCFPLFGFFPPPLEIVSIVWVRRVIADLVRGQSWNSDWLLQGSSASDAKAARGLVGSQPQHLDMETSLLRLSIYSKSTDKTLFGPSFLFKGFPEYLLSCYIHSDILDAWLISEATGTLDISAHKVSRKRSGISDQMDWN